MGQEESKPQPVIKLTDKGPVYDLPALEKLIKEGPGNDDTKVYVISISGKYRSGKSFLLNLLKIYLDYYSQQGTDKGWLGAKDLPIRGWDWRGGSKSVTHGIWMYVYPKMVNDKAIILMDCQGSSDISRSDPTLDNLILFLALQLSDVHILNENQVFGTSCLSRLSVCALHADDNLTGSIFERNIVLVRNWQQEERPQQLDEMYADTTSTSVQRDVRGIKKAFQAFDVEALPHPGRRVDRGSEAGNITLADVEEEFLEAAEKFFYKLLDLMSKDGNLIRSDLLAKFKFVSQRAVGKIMTPQQVYEESLVKAICQQIVEEFQTSIAQLKSSQEGKSLTLPLLEERVASIYKAAVQRYEHHPRVANCKNQYIVADYHNFMEENYKAIVTTLKHEYEVQEATKKLEAAEKLAEESDRKWRETEKAAESANTEKAKLTQELDALKKTFDHQQAIRQDIDKQKDILHQIELKKIQLEKVEKDATAANTTKAQALAAREAAVLAKEQALAIRDKNPPQVVYKKKKKHRFF